MSIGPLPNRILEFSTARIGRRVIAYETLSSTNDVAAILAADPANDGVVILAGYQSAGRGQYDRTWFSRPQSSILMSVIVHPPAHLRQPVILTAWASVGIAGALRRLTGLEPHLKWPNDVRMGGKKVCGILIEQGAAVVAGIGLNVNQTEEEFLAASLPDATSLALLDGKPREHLDVLETLLSQLDDEYGRLIVEDLGGLEFDWKQQLGLLGQQVIAELVDNSTIAGRLIELSFARVEIATSSVTVQCFRPEQVRRLHLA